jgi:hypothetical protein
MVLQHESRMATVIYQLIGAPDTGKQEVAEKLRSFLNEGECAEGCFDIFSDTTNLGGDFGYLTDYRLELLVAAERATRVPSDANKIHTHSLIDSVAYVGLQVKAFLESDETNPDAIRWSTAFNACLQMLIDSKEPDRVFYLPYEGDDDKARELDEAIQDVLDTLEIPYTEINPSEEVATWVSN